MVYPHKELQVILRSDEKLSHAFAMVQTKQLEGLKTNKDLDEMDTLIRDFLTRLIRHVEQWQHEQLKPLFEEIYLLQYEFMEFDQETGEETPLLLEETEGLFFLFQEDLSPQEILKELIKA